MSGGKSSAEASATPAGLDNDRVVQTLRRLGIPVTRENYIKLIHGRPVPNEEWTPEHEMDLPEGLREG